MGAGVPPVSLFGHRKEAYFFSAFLDSPDFFELSDFRELSDRSESSDFDELSVLDESSDFAFPSFFVAESPLEELEEEEGAEDFFA